jgi:putative transposase
MLSPVSFLAVVHCLRTLSLVALDLLRLASLAARPRAALVAENLFLRRQLALFQERKVRPRRADALTRGRHHPAGGSGSLGATRW